MTTNDVSCRDLQIRADRPALRSDWLGGKSHDNFAPIGPFLVPRAFVPDHMNLFGDVMETKVESLGKMRNRFVAETA